MSDSESLYESSSHEEEEREEEEDGVNFANIKKTFTNDVATLEERIREMKETNEEWIERMAVNSTYTTRDNTDEDGNEVKIDHNDDYSREMFFLSQAQSSVLIGLDKLKELDIPTSRPADYFAEMVKGDDQMRKVRENLLMKKKRIEASEKAKKIREQKKYGKKVQQEAIEKKRRDKKQSMMKSKNNKNKNNKHVKPKQQQPRQRRKQKNK